MLDCRVKLDGDARKTGRANGKDKMARRRYQIGCLFVRGKRPKVWVGRWRERVLTSKGSMSTILRSEVLGTVSELSKREAQNLLEDRLRPVNRAGRFLGLPLPSGGSWKTSSDHSFFQH